MSGKRGAREGSIYRRGDGFLGRGDQPRRGTAEVVYAKTRGSVAEKLKSLLKADQDGISLRSSDRLTVGAYLARWGEGAEATVRASTWYRYNSLIRGHLIPLLGRTVLVKLQPADCAAAFAVMAAKGLAPRTIIQARAVLGRALREAEVAGLVARNAARLTRAPSVRHDEMHTLTVEQARALIEAAKTDRLGALYAVALASGAREGELLGLRWSDVDWDREAVKIRRTLQRMSGAFSFAEPKTASSNRTVPLGPSAIGALRRHRVAQALERLAMGTAWQDGDLVFCTEIGTPIDAGNLLSRMHYPLLAASGLPRVRFHDLRHTAATLLLEAGVHPRVVAERLGHATPALVMNTYGHATERMQKDATAALERVLGA